ncbi:hypothetical protein POM88_003247 [Heracleum sosnowskyi]|uniref:Uncharacterized protein n=1 Tax=Heracleum sosnowskyi TaxID=360622 RepID=A0AAD8JFZ8_9APIA|nr:hypothetical protein POM88_003247 [Heracleum sosnowskyi]
MDKEHKKLKKEAVKQKGSTTEGSSKESNNTEVNVLDDDNSHAGSQVDEIEEVGGKDDDDDIEWQTGTSNEAARQRIQEQLSTITAGMVMLNTTEEKLKSGKSSPEREEKPKVNGQSNGDANSITLREKLVLEIKEYLKKGSPASKFKPYINTLFGHIPASL